MFYRIIDHRVRNLPPEGGQKNMMDRYISVISLEIKVILLVIRWLFANITSNKMDIYISVDKNIPP
jgi:hypothetical protein